MIIAKNSFIIGKCESINLYFSKLLYHKSNFQGSSGINVKSQRFASTCVMLSQLAVTKTVNHHEFQHNRLIGHKSADSVNRRLQVIALRMDNILSLTIFRPADVTYFQVSTIIRKYTICINLFQIIIKLFSLIDSSIFFPTFHTYIQFGNLYEVCL